jgi:hypothetical protein
MKKLFKDRLLKMADFLDTVPPKHFCLDVITGITNHNISSKEHNRLIEASEVVTDLKEIKKNMKPHKCGSAACAIGWLPAMFPRSFEWRPNSGDVILRNNLLVNFSAAEHFLGLTGHQCCLLFIPEYYPRDHRGPKSVAKKIRKFVETNKLPDKDYI